MLILTDSCTQGEGNPACHHCQLVLLESMGQPNAPKPGGGPRPLPLLEFLKLDDPRPRLRGSSRSGLSELESFEREEQEEKLTLAPTDKELRGLEALPAARSVLPDLSSNERV